MNSIAIKIHLDSLPEKIAKSLVSRWDGNVIHGRFSSPEKKIMRRRPHIAPSKWAEKHRVLTMSRLNGPWRNEIMPHLAGIMDASFYPSVRTIIVCAAPQSTGKTESVNNCIGYAIDRAPGPVLYVYPDQDTSRENAGDRVLPMIQSSPRLSEYRTGRMDDETNQRIRLQHTVIYFAWARSAARLGNRPIRYVVFDECDKYPDFPNKKETDPISLGEKRVVTYQHLYKIWKISTPTDETGPIWKAFTGEAQVIFDFEAACPFCNAGQVMDFEQIKWPADTRDPEEVLAEDLAWYECVECGAEWRDEERNRATQKGRWIERKSKMELFEYLSEYQPAKIAFHVPSWVSRFVGLSEPASSFLRGLKDKSKLRDFLNNHKAEPWKEVTIKTDEISIIKARCGLDPQTVPPEAIALSCGIDVQKYEFWFVVRAWARDFTNWLIHYGRLATWEDVEHQLFETAYPVTGSEKRMRIWRCGMDTGGGGKFENMSMTEEIYWWIRANGIGRGCRVFATKGSSRPLIGKVHANKPLDRTPSGKPLPGGLQLFSLDTEKLKDMVIYRLGQAKEHGPHASYLHNKTGNDYARHIEAEEKRRDAKGFESWVQLRADNHLFDCECLAQVVVDPEWPGGGLNLVRIEQPEPVQISNDTGPGNREHWLQRREFSRPNWLG